MNPEHHRLDATRINATLHCLLLQLLLELYNPLVVTRANRAAKQAPSADLRELMAAARRGLLQAAAKFDASRTAGSSSSSARLGLLADGYIRNALRNVLQEVGMLIDLVTHEQQRRQGVRVPHV
jgi:hypothetical protein